MNGICPEYFQILCIAEDRENRFCSLFLRTEFLKQLGRGGRPGVVRFSDLTILTLLSVDRIEYLWPHRQGIEHTTCLL